MNMRMTCVWLLTITIPLTTWAGSLNITRVWPDKIVYKPGESANIIVDVTNGTPGSVTGKMSAMIRWGLTEEDAIPAQTITVPAGGKATVKFVYALPRDRKWGHEARVSFCDEAGVALTTGREYFTVGDNPWELGHYSTCYWSQGWKKPEGIDSMCNARKPHYITTYEAYSWEPSVFDDMTPETNVWISGQGGYKESKENWQYFVERSHANGRAVVTYVQLYSYGAVGREFLRKHPDWWNFNTDGIPPLCFGAGDGGNAETGLFLPGKPEVGDYWIEEIARSKAMFGWDGFRSDGNCGPQAGYDYTGKFHELKDPDGANAEYLAKVRRELTRRYPDFKFGWNNPVVADSMGGQFGVEVEPKQNEVMVPGSYMLWENFNSAGQPASVWHDWKRLVQDMQKEAGYIREHGGFSHAGWMPSTRFLEAVVCACGGHIDGWGESSIYPDPNVFLNYRRFEFRWAEFLWDIGLRYVRPAMDMVMVEAPDQVWWRDFVHVRDLKDGGKRVIVHLVNMPSDGENAWKDKAPAPVANIRVSFKSPAGKKLLRVAVVSPDVEGDVINVTPSPDGLVTLPELKVWSVIVAEFQ